MYEFSFEDVIVITRILIYDSNNNFIGFQFIQQNFYFINLPQKRDQGGWVKGSLWCLNPLSK